MYEQQRRHLERIFNAAVTAVQPKQLFEKLIAPNAAFITAGDRSFALDGPGKIIVAGAGKAAASMAFELERLAGRHISTGLVVTKEGHGTPLRKIEVAIGAHPLPDERSVAASFQLLDLLSQATPQDTVIFLLSGGASSLLTDLPEGLNLDDINHTSDLLLRSGANIHEVNAVRKHLSRIKGGQLLRFMGGARVVTFAISDVIGSDFSVIGSGLTFADASSFGDALDVLKKYSLLDAVPVAVSDYLEKGMRGLIPETLKPGDPLLQRCNNHLLGDNATALDAAAASAMALGYETHITDRNMDGDVGQCAREWARKMATYWHPSKKICLLAGGETTVKVTGKGLGGRNQHFALTAAMRLPEFSHVSLLAAGTDGTDGPTDATGAFADTCTVSRAGALGIDTEAFLQNNDSYHFFDRLGSLHRTGPTQTNVMDIIITLIN